MPYIGTSPSNGVRQTYDYTATAGQTSFSGSDNNSQTLTYTDSAYIDVYQNGILLIPSDYTATTGTTVVLDTGATVSDTLQIVVYDVFSVADTVSASDGGSFGGNVGVGGTLAVTGIATFTDDIIIGDGKTIGSASDVDAMTISSGGVVNFTQIPTVSSIQLTNAPAFEATVSSAQSISDNTATKITFNTETFDSDSKYDHSTNYRFTPTVAGKYFVYLVLGVTANDSAELNNMYAFIYKNGSEYKAAHFNFAGNPIRYATATANAIITFDSDDYIEAYVQTADAAGNADVQPGVYTTFGAYKMIGI